MIKCVSCERPMSPEDQQVKDLFKRVWCMNCVVHTLTTIQSTARMQNPIPNRNSKPI